VPAVRDANRDTVLMKPDKYFSIHEGHEITEHLTPLKRIKRPHEIGR
jgi:hypothetical protein